MKSQNTILLEKYFEKWKNITESCKQSEENSAKKIKQLEKLDELIDVLKLKQQKQTGQSVCKTKIVKHHESLCKAQQSLIENLTQEIQEKNHQINELKLGILTDNALESIKNSKISIREIFSNCSVKVRCKLPPPVEYTQKLMVSTQKAPKLVRDTEKRALERARNHEAILERKRLIEEEKRRLLEETIEKKRVQDEEETKRNLNLIKERRKKELIKQQIRQANKLVFITKWNKATNFYNRKTKVKTLKILLENVKINREKWEFSIFHYKQRLCLKVFTNWQRIINDKYELKYKIVDCMYQKKLLKETFNRWRHFRLDCVRSMQVAEDYYDFRLQSNTFIYWHRFVCIQYVLRDKQEKLAKKQYEKKLLFNYFYQWCSLKAVNQLEKAKEMKKRKWREKVWEILPDYKPNVK